MYMFIEYDNDFNHKIFSGYSEVNDICSKLKNHHINENVLAIDFYIGFSCIASYYNDDKSMICFSNVKSDIEVFNAIKRCMDEKKL